MNIIIRSESSLGRGGRRSEGDRLGNKTPRRSWPSSCKEEWCQPLGVWNMPRRKGRSPRDRCHASTEGPSLCHLSKYSRSSNATEPSAGFREAVQEPGFKFRALLPAAARKQRQNSRDTEDDPFHALNIRILRLSLSLLLVWLKNEFFFYLTGLLFNYK